MKGLTLTQPWATLVAIGAKSIETRSWYTSYRGPIAIHAAKGFPRDAMRLCLEQPFLDALYPAGFVGAGALPVGAIVAIANLVDCLPTAFTKIPEARLLSEQAFGNFEHGRYAWWLLDVRRLPEPIPCKGALGLWTVPVEIESRISETKP